MTVLAREGVEVHLHALQIKTEPFWLGAHERNVILQICIIVRIQHRMHLVRQIVHVVTGSNSTIQSNYRTRRIAGYFCPNHHRSASMFNSWNQVFRIIGFLGGSPNVKPA
jgi:hypothetical protein